MLYEAAPRITKSILWPHGHNMRANKGLRSPLLANVKGLWPLTKRKCVAFPWP